MARAMSAVRSATLAALDLVLPVTCVGCGSPSRRWCPDCAREVLRALADGPHPVRPSPTPPGFPLCLAAASYAGPLAAAVRAHKDEDRVDAARALAAALAPVLAMAVTACPESPVLVPAPSRLASRRQRGRDPVRVLSERAADGSWPVVSALRTSRHVADQAGLGAAERLANLSGHVWVTSTGRRAVTGRSVVLVDDVVTTGATLVAASAALHAAGARTVVAAVLCATKRRGCVARLSQGADVG